jgi:integrase
MTFQSSDFNGMMREIKAKEHCRCNGLPLHGHCLTCDTQLPEGQSECAACKQRRSRRRFCSGCRNEFYLPAVKEEISKPQRNGFCSEQCHEVAVRASTQKRFEIGLAQVPPRYRDCSLTGFDAYSEQLAEKVRLVKNWANGEPETGLYLFGGVGTGKTHLPLTQEEWKKLVIACDTYEVQVGAAGFLNAQRLRALIRLMRYSGLRISDAVNLSTDRITDDKLFLYTQTTGTAVYTVLPPFVVKELAATPRVTDKLYFWNGNGELETAVKDWQAKIRTLFDLAGVDKGENFMVSHRLRDTFAVECLLAGVPLERVSILLGHSTIKVTERHYAPWIQKRQQQLEADLRAMWSNDEQGTKEVQPQNGRPN